MSSQGIVTVEEQPVKEEKTPSQMIVATFEAALNLTEQGFIELEEKKKGLLIDVSTDAGFKDARKERTEQNATLKDIDRLAIDGKNDIDSARSTLKDRVIKLYKPTVSAFEAEDTKRKAAKKKAEDDEALRKSKIKDQICGIRLFSIGIAGKSSEEISGILEAVDMIDISESFAEFTQEAMLAKKETLGELNLALSSAIQNENLAAGQLELKKQQDEQEAANKAQERLSKLMMIPIGMMGKSSEDIGYKALKVAHTDVDKDEFGTLFEQAVTAKENVVNQLNAMFDQQVLVEKSQTLLVATEQVEQPKVEAVAIEPEQKIAIERSYTKVATETEPKESERDLKIKAKRKQVDFWAQEYNVGDAAIRDLMPLFEQMI